VKKSLYERLQVSPNAKIDKIRRACTSTIASLQSRCDAGDQKALAEVAELKEGYELLSNPARRAAYNETLRRDRTDMGSNDFDDDVQILTPGRVVIAGVVAVAIAMAAYYRSEANSAAEMAAAIQADSAKRAEVLAQQQRELKEKERALLAGKPSDEEVAKQQAEIKRLQEYSSKVAADIASSDKQQAIEAKKDAKDRQVEAKERKEREKEEQTELEQHQQDELDAARRKLQELENNR
jgi:curved DNA-binding protein CbpA